MKKTLLFFVSIMLFVSARAQEQKVDTVAVMILDHMASVIGELNSCSFTLNTSIDVKDPDYGLITQNETDEVYLTGPDKMHVNFNGDKGHRGFWYNGLTSVMYSYDENNYVIIDAPDNIIAMIDTLNTNYGIEFPAADFFYPTFTDDMVSLFDNIILAGKRTLNGKECLLILANNKDISVQIWFSSDAFTLPQKFIILYKNDGNKQYEATFSNWNLNPEIPPSVFDFIQPPNAREISILPKYKK